MAMQDEEKDILHHICNLQGTDGLLAAELQIILSRRVRMNDNHRARIERIYSLKSYTGSQKPGIRVGRFDLDVGLAVLVDNGHTADVDNTDNDRTPDEDDHAADELDRLHDFIGQLDSITT